jgi:DNA-binding response OmpR family regulator
MEYDVDMKKVMIIEDNKDLQEIYKMSFENAGYEVFAEMDGLDGISSVIDKKPDIVILDIMMPNMDGFAFLKSMKENTSIDIPVIVCSNLSDVDTINKATREGAVAVLLKADYSGRQLVDKINYILSTLKK